MASWSIIPAAGYRSSGLRIFADRKYLLVAWCVLCVPLARAEQFRIADKQDLAYLGLQSELDEFDDSYEILFVPGAMGSKLSIGDDVIWGKGKPDPKKLLIDPKVEVTADVLKEFDIFPRDIDIYGSGLEVLKEAFEKDEYIAFPYDWRIDIGEIAERFDSFARDPENGLVGKRVLIVAHSMGGVVMWQWLHDNPPDKRPFELLGLVLLGAPIKGSSELARILLTRYKPTKATSNMFYEFAFKLLFSDAQAAIMTFPAVYELLEYSEDPSGSSVMIETEKGLIPQDLLDYDRFWMPQLRGDKEKKNGKSRLVRFADQAGISEADYASRVRSAVEQARKFRMSFNAKQGQFVVYYLYSDEHSMESKFIISATTRQIVWTGDDNHTDGRVPSGSATNVGNKRDRPWMIFRLNSVHGRLLSDKGFESFVRLQIRELYEGGISIAVAPRIRSDPDLHRKFIDGAYLLPLPSRRFDSFLYAQVDTEAVARLNRLAINRHASIDPSRYQSVDRAKKIGRAFQSEALDLEKWAEESEITGVIAASVQAFADHHRRMARMVFQSDEALNPESYDARSLNHWGFGLLRAGYNYDAIDVLSRAAQVADEKEDSHLTQELAEKIHLNLGCSHFRVGQLEEAAAQFALAPNNALAKGHLATLF